MSLRLHTRGVAANFPSAILGRVVRVEENREVGERSDCVLTGDISEDADVQGYAGLLMSSTLLEEQAQQFRVPTIHSTSWLDHLHTGDVVALQPDGRVRTLYRVGSPHNVIFTTDRCNSYCLMCSQPPLPVEDSSKIREHLRLIELMDPRTREVGVTGGEPTLLKRDFLRIVERCKLLLPETSLHILSNGRLFYYGSFARDLAALEHPDLMIGVPLYSDLDFEHDYIVQAEGAFDQTLIGLQNLARFGVAVEIRVVLHRQSYERLPRLAEFLYRNLPFVAHVALMGLEQIGLAIPNLGDLWIDPAEYQGELSAAVDFLAARGMRVSIYNHQLCTVPERLWKFCRRSISDWKNEYLPVCAECRLREECGGFFLSSLKKRISRLVQSIP
jgi:His-Xaa-Ser system radical SAM maturase HxsC